MPKSLRLMGINVFFVLILSTLAFAQTQTEQLTITTYYPSPYGVYRELRSMRMAIGDNYIKGGDYDWGDEISSDVDLAVEGNVGIGTAEPSAKLDVSDGMLTGGNSELLTLHSAYGSGTQKALTWRDTTNITGQIDTRYNNPTVDMVFGHLYNSGYQTGDLVTIKGSGNVGIGRSPTTYKLEVEGDASKTTAGSWQVNSDQRIKKDISDISDAVSTLDLLRPVKFKYTQEYKAQHPSIRNKYYYNFIAQEFQQVFPNEVTVTNDTLPNREHILAIDPYVLTPYLVKAVQEQHQQIEKLQREIDELKAKLEAK